MDQPTSTGTFSISELATRLNVAVPTLRSWERRYGFPVPHRTNGGHRRYSAGDLQACLELAEMTRKMPLREAIARIKERTQATRA